MGELQGCEAMGGVAINSYQIMNGDSSSLASQEAGGCYGHFILTVAKSRHGRFGLRLLDAIHPVSADISYTSCESGVGAPLFPWHVVHKV